MSTPPRRRRPDAPKPKPEGGGWLPTIAMGLGVIVAGLGIGALVAIFMQRNTEKQLATPNPVVVGVRSPAAISRSTRGPIALATLVPPRTPRPTPTNEATSPPPKPSSAPSIEPTTEPSPVATVVPPTPAVSDKPASSALATTEPAVSVTPAAVVAITPAPVASIAPVPGPSAPADVAVSPVAAPSAQVASAYDEHASAVVRRYLDALIRGDAKSAYAALGDSGGTLSEQAFLDASARIVSIKVTRIDASNASVGCEIASAKGRYYATYHVAAANGGPYISQHDYIKV